VLANPNVEVEVGTDGHAGRARVTTGEEHKRIWEAQKAAFPQFAEYEEKTEGRQIPVVVIDRV
jgi:deazaflavin-dependent oxidoreductase (nitroreductase family)